MHTRLQLEVMAEISIPEAERDALGLKEGDLVQVMVLPIEKKTKPKEVKQ